MAAFPGHSTGIPVPGTDVRATRTVGSSCSTTTAGPRHRSAGTRREAAVERGSEGRIGGTEQIPLLTDLLEEFPDRQVQHRRQGRSGGYAARRTHPSANATDRVCLVSFADHRLTRLRAALGPDVALALGPQALFRLFRASALRREFRTTAVAAQVPLSYQGVTIVTPRFIATAHAAGLEVHVWTIDEPGEMRRLLTLGVDGIMTDRPDLLREVLIEQGSWQRPSAEPDPVRLGAGRYSARNARSRFNQRTSPG